MINAIRFLSLVLLFTAIGCGQQISQNEEVILQENVQKDLSNPAVGSSEVEQSDSKQISSEDSIQKVTDQNESGKTADNGEASDKTKNKKGRHMKSAVAEIGKHSNMLPRNRRISLPLVDREGDKVLVRRLIYFVRAIPGKGSFMTPPKYVATYDWTDKKFISLKQLNADPKTDQEQLYEAPKFESTKDIIPEFEEIWRLYDILIPQYIERPETYSSDTIKAAKSYLSYLVRHQEKPLLGHYEKYGGAFIDFVKECASKQ